MLLHLKTAYFHLPAAPQYPAVHLHVPAAPPTSSYLSLTAKCSPILNSCSSSSVSSSSILQILISISQMLPHLAAAHLHLLAAPPSNSFSSSPASCSPIFQLLNFKCEPLPYLPATHLYLQMFLHLTSAYLQLPATPPISSCSSSPASCSHNFQLLISTCQMIPHLTADHLYLPASPPYDSFPPI